MSLPVTKYMTKRQVAQLMHCTVRTIDRWRRQGVLPYVKMGPNSNAKVLFDTRDVQDFMDRRKHNTFLRGHGEGWQYNSGFSPGGDVVSGSREERDVPDNAQEFDQDYSDKPPMIY